VPRNAWLILPALFVVALLAYELRYVFEPSRDAVLSDACAAVVRQHVPTPATFEVHEARESGTSGKVLVVYDRQVFTGAVMRLSAQCQFARSFDGPLELTSVSIEGKALERVFVETWNMTNRRLIQWRWPRPSGG